MIFLAVTTAYLTAHFFIYLALRFRVPALRTESGIFRYHLFSFASLATGSGVVWALDSIEHACAAALGALSLHGIYSISFLEVWSLAEGGYSLSILEVAADPRGISGTRAESLLENIGERKRSVRVAALEAKGLLRREGGEIELTAKGRYWALAFRGLAWLSNLRSVG